MYKCLSRNSDACEDVQTPSASREALYWGFVDVDLSTIENKAVRLNITLPARVVALVDEAAARSSESRSGFLARAALEHIAAERS